jgi:hypothetical protein
MFKKNQHIQVFFNDNVSREGHIIEKLDDENYKVKYLDNEIIKSETIHASRIANLPLPFKDSHISKIKIYFVGLAIIYLLSETIRFVYQVSQLFKRLPSLCRFFPTFQSIYKCKK